MLVGTLLKGGFPKETGWSAKEKRKNVCTELYFLVTNVINSYIRAFVTKELGWVFHLINSRLRSIGVCVLSIFFLSIVSSCFGSILKRLQYR